MAVECTPDALAELAKCFLSKPAADLAAYQTYLLCQALAAFAGPGTITPPGTTGAQAITTNSGRVNFAAGATSLVVTNAAVASTSRVFTNIAKAADATAANDHAVAGAGFFTIYMTAPTGETPVDFFVLL